MTTTSDALDEKGWIRLSEGRWREARASFEKCLRDVETPRALEGLSWAAWWLDDEEAVFGAREDAYRRYRDAGDAASAARMATWLAIDELDFHGALPVAGAWLGRARRLLAPLEPGPDHGWLLFMEAYTARVIGEHERAAALGAEAAALGRRLGVLDLEMLGLAIEGSSLVDGARVEDGMGRLDEAAATAVAGDAAIPISSAWTCCFLVTACTVTRDYERAFAWCDRIADFAERYGSRYMLGFCRGEYALVHLWRGRWADAEALLEASIEDFTRSRPAMAGEALAALAELRRRQGRPDDAVRLLGRAGASPAAQLCGAALALDRGDAANCVELLERRLRQLPVRLAPARAPALELLVRARIAGDEIEEARPAMEELRQLERLVGTPALRAAADLAEGRLAAAAGDHDRARPLLEDALDGFDRCGAPYEAAQARIELASALLGLDRADDARAEAQVAAARLQELGAATEARRAHGLMDAAARARGDALPAEVTPREQDVLALLAEGLTNRQIAERLVLSEHTVHRHVANILRKLGAPSRTAATVHAVRHGLIDEDQTA